MNAWDDQSEDLIDNAIRLLERRWRETGEVNLAELLPLTPIPCGSRPCWP